MTKKIEPRGNVIGKVHFDGKDIIGTVKLEVIQTMEWDLIKGLNSIGEQVDMILGNMGKDDKVRKVTVHLDEERI